MYRLIIAIASLLVIDEYTFGLRRRFLEWRQRQDSQDEKERESRR